jgi:hypothetical protein
MNSILPLCTFHLYVGTFQYLNRYDIPELVVTIMMPSNLRNRTSVKDVKFQTRLTDILVNITLLLN